MVVNRILQWYRSGINPQDRLPFLATYLGHRDINSTLVYITVTQDLLQDASERFRAVGAPCLNLGQEVAAMNKAASTRSRHCCALLPRMAGRAAQCIHPYHSILPRHLAAVPPVRRAAKRREVAEITLADLAASEVSAFLSHAEHERDGTIGTRNCRLAAIRSFFHFVASKEPDVRSRSAPKSSPSRSSARRSRHRAILSRGRWRRSSLSPTVRRWKGCAIMRCSPSSTTAARASRKRSICARSDPVRNAELRAPPRQGAQGTYLPALAGNRDCC